VVKLVYLNETDPYDNYEIFDVYEDIRFEILKGMVTEKRLKQ